LPVPVALPVLCCTTRYATGPWTRYTSARTPALPMSPPASHGPPRAERSDDPTSSSRQAPPETAGSTRPSHSRASAYPLAMQE